MGSQVPGGLEFGDPRTLLYGCFQKYRENPQIIHFNRVFHYKPSILGVFPLFLETPI